MMQSIGILVVIVATYRWVVERDAEVHRRRIQEVE